MAGALGVIGFSGKTNLISDNLCLLKLSLSLTVGEMFKTGKIAESILENQRYLFTSICSLRQSGLITNSL